MRSVLAAAAAWALVAGVAHAAPGIKTVKDWTAVCDNVGDCRVYGFTAEDSDQQNAYLIIKRRGGPSGQPTLAITYDPEDPQPSASWKLTIDGHAIPGLAQMRADGSKDGGARVQLSGAEALTVIEALKNGKSSLDGEGADGKAAFSISLAGSAATLLWADDQQGRVGTVTALSRKGPKPASAVPPRGAVPTIVVAAAVSQKGLPKFAPKSLIKTDPEDCDHDTTGIEPDDIIARLAPGLVLWAPECSMAAYNMSTIMFLGDEHGGHMKRLKVPEAPGSGQVNADFLTNAEFDPKTQTLSQFSKGRGVGDCGEAARWVWTGKAFALIGEETMPECRGVELDDWAPIFVARRG